MDAPFPLRFPAAMVSHPAETPSHPSPAATAVREALGLPGLVLFASYVGFGSLVRESGLGLPEGLVSTATGWALPGQVALVELYAVGASVVTIALAAALTNTRLMPMVVELSDWFEKEVGAACGGITCEAIVGEDGPAGARQKCAMIVANTYAKAMEILAAKGFAADA